MFKNLSLSESLSESIVNIEEKSRSNLFTWRGQFSPQLIEELIRAYGKERIKIFDPFLGSGTTLYEAGRLGLSACGCEINPAALAFARIYQLINSNKQEINNAIYAVELAISEYITDLPIFSQKPLSELPDKLIRTYTSNNDELIKIIIEAFVVGLDLEAKKLDLKRVHNVWGILRSNIENLPESNKPLQGYQQDARKTTIEENSIDFVVTSPPYINVFNYHQNYRKSVEALGVDILKVAQSEIGANRKFRGNRFLTAVQYCMDMSQVFAETHRVCKKDAKIIFIVGRESNVRKTSFKNAEMLKRVAAFCGLKLSGQQHRKFANKFGQNIYEEILRFSICDDQFDDNHIERARSVGIESLKSALAYCDDSVIDELNDAIEKAKNINVSPLLGV
jgi:hypothetical protein